jgi:hypothetical protein
MYAQNIKSINAFKGCGFGCVYCEVSFKRQAKRQKPQPNGKGCQQCYDYAPHAHLERLQKPSPKTTGEEVVFFPSSGDLAFASKDIQQKHIDYARANPQTNFLMQTKDPRWFRQFEPLPNNVIIAITLETDRVDPLLTEDYHNSYRYLRYADISNAPSPVNRVISFFSVVHNRKQVTIEPILLCTISKMVAWLKEINPERVYVGYANDGQDGLKLCLPEPTVAETENLIAEIEKAGLKIYRKTIRPAWYETGFVSGKVTK